MKFAIIHIDDELFYKLYFHLCQWLLLYLQNNNGNKMMIVVTKKKKFSSIHSWIFDILFVGLWLLSKVWWKSVPCRSERNFYWINKIGEIILFHQIEIKFANPPEILNVSKIIYTNNLTYKIQLSGCSNRPRKSRLFIFQLKPHILMWFWSIQSK